MNLYAYVGNDPVNGWDPTGTETFAVGRRIFNHNEAAWAAAIAGRNFGPAAAAAAYSTTINTKHGFFVVTAPGTSLTDGQIERIYSWGPEGANRSAGGPFGATVALDRGSPTGRDDRTALNSIIDGSPLAGVTFSEVEGITNADVHSILGAASSRRPYNPVPATAAGTTNSNSEFGARGQGLSAAGGSSFTPPSGIYPGLQQSNRVELVFGTCNPTRIEEAKNC